LIELFRKEVLTRRASRLYGDINLALPVSWQLLGYLFLAALATGAVFLFSATYTRVEVVGGVVTPDKGVAAVTPSRTGVIIDLYVVEGARVARGAPIARIRVTETLASGGAASDRQSAALDAQQEGLESQSQALGQVYEQERARQVEQIDGLDRELKALSTQIDIQRQLVDSASRLLDKTREVAQNGFISQQTLLSREEALLMRRQQLAQLEQTRANKETMRRDAQGAVSQLAAQTLADNASARLRLGELGRQRVDASAADGYLVTAPVAGVATAITGKVGQLADTTSPIASILPTGATLRAELLVPAQTIGFVKVGEDVRVSIDGFPVEQYGTLKAKIVTVPTVSVSRKDSQGNPISVYPVLCRFSNLQASPLGRRYALVAGMTLSARIETRRQSLMQWLFQPAFKMARR